MNTLSIWAFWLAAAVLGYIYVGFALLVYTHGRWRHREIVKRPITPRISMIVAAHNEAGQIGQKVDNCLALDYPAEALEVIIGSDGSDDDTERIVARRTDPRVRLLVFPRRGKTHVLNGCVPVSRGELLVFSDANTHLDRAALRNLARNFADPSVGGVCGNQLYRASPGGESSGAGERLYWAYDKWLKRQQTRGGSIVAADGAIYAIRRHLYQPPPTAAVTDDFAISTGVVERGWRLVYENEAFAYEPATEKAGAEFHRKVRIIVRGLHGVALRRRLLNPFRYGFYSIVLFSHKVLRRAAALFLLLLLAASVVLARGDDFYVAALVLQLLFYLLAGAGYMTRARRVGRTKWLYAPFHYCLLHGAALVAFGKLLRGTRIETWQPQRRRVVG